MRKILALLCLLFFNASGLAALDLGLDLYLAQSTLRKIVVGTNGIVVQTFRSYQVNYAVRLSQDIGDLWTIGGNVTSVNPISTNGNGFYPVPEQSVFAASVEFAPSDMFQFGFDYSISPSIHILSAPIILDNVVISETMIESEPTLSCTFNAPFGSDWFNLSASVSAGYYFSPYFRGWGFALSVMPLFSIPAWSVDIGIPLSAGYSLQGYRGAPETGFENGIPSVNISWSPGDVFTLSFSAGYVFSFSTDAATRSMNSAPFFQLDFGFYLTTDRQDGSDETNESNS